MRLRCVKLKTPPVNTFVSTPGRSKLVVLTAGIVILVFDSDSMPMLFQKLNSTSSADLDSLTQWLHAQSGSLETPGAIPKQQLQKCADADVFRWFLPAQYNGLGFSPQQIADGYLRLASNCLTTTFVVTQWVAAVKRMLIGDNEDLRQRLFPELVTGRSHITVGISHLTTSRQHLGRPALTAKKTEQGWVLDGYCPWVTAASYADYLLVGADIDDRQILIVVPTDLPGVTVHPGHQLLALTASQTSRVDFQNVVVDHQFLVAGPVASVLQCAGNQGTASVQTSTLALAVAGAAIDFLGQQAAKRDELTEKHVALSQSWIDCYQDLIGVATGTLQCSNEQLRTQANSLVLRATQASLVAAKGAGFVAGHPVGRWCREAMFFLVWSCPQTVQDASLCELAGIH